MQERRTTIRVAHDTWAQYCPSEDLVPRDGRVTNLSERGIGLLTREGYKIGERLTVSFKVPGASEPVTATGAVRWSNPEASRKHWYATALEWFPLGEQSSEPLHRFLREKSRRVFEDVQRPHAPVQRRWFTVIAAAGVTIVLLVGVAIGILAGRNQQLQNTIAQRDAVIGDLEGRAGLIANQLRNAKLDLAVASAEVTRMDESIQQLQQEMTHLSGTVGQFQDSYTQMQIDREALGQEVLRLEQARADLAQRFASLPALREAVRGIVDRRMGDERRARLARQARQREDAAKRFLYGNRGYLVYEGVPMLQRTPGQIRVHQPELSSSILESP